MSYLLEELQPYNFSLNFGENVKFTSSYYEGYPPSNSALYFIPYCNNYNTPLTIPNGLHNGYDFLGYSLDNFNSPVYINPNHPNLEAMAYFFYYCPNFNQEFNIPEKVYNMYYTLYECHNFNTNVYCYAKVGNCYSPENYNNQIGNFHSAFSGWAGNFNMHFMENSNPVILDSAFSGCGNLNTNITIPDSVYSIYHGFSYCYNLNSNIRLPDNIMAAGCFQYCANFNQNIRIPHNSNIAGLFESCENFNQDIFVPLCRGSNMSEQEYNCYQIFKDCTNLNANVHFETGYKILRGTFTNCSNFNYPITIPDTVEALYETFYHCSNFNTQITFGSSVTNLAYAFSGCSNLNFSMQLPSGVTDMHNTFGGCSNLNTIITIPEATTNLRSCFRYCVNFDQPVTIPSNVTDMSACFTGCRNFNHSFTVPSGVTTVRGMMENCYNFNSIISLPSTVESMSNLFMSCNNFNQPITIPSGVIDAVSAFYGTPNFRQPITVPSSCSNLFAMFRASSANNVTFECAEINWANDYMGCSPLRLRDTWYGNASFNTAGFSNGDTVATFNLNKDCVCFWDEYDSEAGQHVRRECSTNDMFFAYGNRWRAYSFVGVFEGYVRGSHRTLAQADNYQDYVANFNDKAPSLRIDPQWYERDNTYIRFTYYDWANGSSDATTPKYYIYLNFI